MSLFRKSPFVVLLLSLGLVAACNESDEKQLETLCNVEGAFECSKDAQGLAVHRLCVAGEWASTTCAESQICRESGCAAQAVVCEATANRCLDFKTIEHCVASEVAQTETCGEGFHCDLGACVAGRVCHETVTTCFDDESLEICVVDQLPIEEACGADLECNGGACVDACHNNRFDEGEEAVDCGGVCDACVSCRVHADCGVDGFCDSASGYVCSRRCRTNADCTNTKAWDGNYCRGDGRCSPKVFETVWELTADDPTVVLPFNAYFANATCDFQILWGDEPAGTDITLLPHVTDCTAIENRTHTYSEAGRYHIKIIGTYDGWGNFKAINTTDGYEFASAATKLRGVTSFGPVGLGVGAFHSATELVSLPQTDVPDATKLVNLDVVFYRATSFNAPIGHWDISNVSSATLMFCSVFSFNQPLAQWDTSHVTSMMSMFESAKAFNQPIGDWDTSNITHMNNMFRSASAFNQPLGSWNTSNVVDMNWVFYGAGAFNQPIGEWDTSSVTQMNNMFAGALAFNRDLSKWILKSEVELEGIFESSAMDNTNLCKLKAVGGAWLAQWVNLGKTVVCD